MKMIKVAMGGGPATAGISERGSGLQHSVCFFFGSVAKRAREKAKGRTKTKTKRRNCGGLQVASVLRMSQTREDVRYEIRW